MDAAALCLDLGSLSKFLGFAPQHLYYLIESPGKFYRIINIPKHSDPATFREISIPTSELKGIQRFINQKILSQVLVSDCVFSYVKGRSIVMAARNLCPGKAALRVDIKDFFPSVTFPRVFGLFKSLGFNEAVSFMLARLTTLDNKLAQGAPTSPAISNIILSGLDKRLESLSKSWELGYLRYSDDLFFYKDKNFNHKRLLEIVDPIVTNSGFALNVNKVRYLPKGLPRITLGLLTHSDAPRIPGPRRQAYRSMFFRASRDLHWAQENTQILKGTLEWYKCVYGRDETYDNYRAILHNASKIALHPTYKSS